MAVAGTRRLHTHPQGTAECTRHTGECQPGLRLGLGPHGKGFVTGSHPSTGPGSPWGLEGRGSGVNRGPCQWHGGGPQGPPNPKRCGGAAQAPGDPNPPANPPPWGERASSLLSVLHMLRGPTSFPRSPVGPLDVMPHPPARTRPPWRPPPIKFRCTRPEPLDFWLDAIVAEDRVLVPDPILSHKP